jgi:hypothetical protein
LILWVSIYLILALYQPQFSKPFLEEQEFMFSKSNWYSILSCSIFIFGFALFLFYLISFRHKHSK